MNFKCLGKGLILAIVVFKWNYLALRSWHKLRLSNAPAGNGGSCLHWLSLELISSKQDARVKMCPNPIVPPHQLTEWKLQNRSSLLNHTDSSYNNKEGSWTWQGVRCLHKHCSFIPAICWHWSNTWLGTNAVPIKLRMMKI